MKPNFRNLLAIILVVGVVFWLGVSSRAWGVKDEKREANTSPQTTPIVAGKAVGFGVSPAVRDLRESKLRIAPELLNPTTKKYEVKNPLNGEAIKPAVRDTDALVDQALAPATNSPSVVPTPAVSFDGISGQEQATITGIAVAPPDTVGDVGPNHYVQMVNNLVRIYNKSGTPLVAPFRLSSITSVIGGPCANVNDGDPIVNYDPLADRWIMSQFCVAPVPGHQVFAVSQTPDPTGAYFVYDFVHPNARFHDYPKVGVWPDAYYMSVNQFTAPTGGTFAGAGAFAYDRNKMLAGDPTASYVFFDLVPTCPTCGGQNPTDLDGTMPPPANSPNLFIEQRPSEAGDPFDGLRVFAFSPNFANPPASTFNQVGATDLALAAFDGRAPTSRNAIEQPGTTVGLDPLFGPLMYKLAFRNLGTLASPVNSYVLNFTVNVGGATPTNAATYQAGIRWAELRRDNAGVMSVFQQGTQATNPNTPAGGTNTWMGSIAQDNQGNTVLGYTTSGTTAPDFPSIRYAGRLTSDPAGQLAQGQTDGFLGTGVQAGAGNRWGDYSSMNVDPADDCSFWYTQEYRLAANNSTTNPAPFFWSTRVIGGIKFPSCTPPARGSVTGTITSCSTGLPLSGATVNATGGFFRSTAANGTYTVINVPVGTYSVTAAKAGGFGAATNSSVIVANGGATTVNLCLNEIPLLGAATTAVVSESCPPANGAVDPGETVTLAFTVQNNGLAGTTALTGALANTGGVTNAGAAQNYGNVPQNGGSATRNFTFTASNSMACGSTISATIALTDGATNYGSIVYKIPMGTVSASSPTFTYNGPAVAIPDNLPAGVNIPLTVSGLNNGIADIDFRINGTASSFDPLSTGVGLNHAAIGNLQFKLTSPAGITTTIMERGGGDATCTANNLHQMVLDDEAALGLQCPAGDTNGGPLSGVFKPRNILAANPLATFDGEVANGVWMLNVSDLAAGNTGSLRSFSLIITPRVCCGQTPLSTVQFASPNLNVNEGNASATFNVNRVGDASAPASVEFATTNDTAMVSCSAQNGLASSRCDFTAAGGVLNFAAGETTKAVTILLADDLYVENNETINLNLISSSGTALGPQSAATVTINDNDGAAGTDTVFAARLEGTQEAPANASTATGTGSVTLNEAETQITVNMSFSGLGSAQTAAHIHSTAPVGVNAPVLFNLGTGQISGATFDVTPQQVVQLRAGLMYFNVHTANFPGGEIRGQIVSQPMENARFFVRQQYADFLARTPDQSGFDFWTGQITTVCGSNLNCIRQRRVDVSNAFFFELEFQQTGAFVYRLYRAAYGNTQPFPNPQSPMLPSNAVFVADRARVVGGASLPAAQLALANAFVNRPEFTALYPASQTAAQFVDALLGSIQAASGANLASQRDALISLFGTGGRGAVLYRLADDNTANPINNRPFIDAEYNRAFVLTQYFGYLRRDADLAGFNFWLNIVSRFPLRSPTGQNAMVCAFITSTEYQQRFSVAAPRSNSECPAVP